MNGSPSTTRTPAKTRRQISLLTVVVVVAALALAKEFFLPLVLAILISFLLAPLIRAFEKWHLGRVPSVIVAAVLAFSLIGGLGYVMAGQMVELASRLPGYKNNLHAKIGALRFRADSPLSRANVTLQELGAELSGRAEKKTEPPTAAARDAAASHPVPVEVVDRAGSALGVFKDLLVAVVGPLGTAAVVVLFVVFMLLEREDLRDRFIHLVGRGRLQLTTQAIDEAGRRVSRYLLAQFAINASYGLPVGLGLHWIGLPNAVLWGLLSALLRYIPYVGAWIAAAFPLALSLAISPGWTMPLLTLALFVGMELLVANVLEPWVYGTSTGLSPMAIIVSAVFWAWLWGGIGLLLATPLTVCLAVLGKYIPSLGYLEILLGETPPIAASDRLYQRLLALDEEESADILERAIAQSSLGAAFDEVLLPAVSLAEADRLAGTLPLETLHEILSLVRGLIGEVGETPPVMGERAPVRVMCLPASSEADEVIALMLARLLSHQQVNARVCSSRSMASEMVLAVEEAAPSVVCISALPRASVMPAIYLARRLMDRKQAGGRVVLGLWNEGPSEVERRRPRFRRVGLETIFSTLEKAAVEIAHTGAFAPVPEVSPVATP